MPFTCIKCNASFPKNQGLLAHQNRKRPCDLELAAKVLACTECGKRFTRQDSLLRHSRQSCTGSALDGTQNARVARLEQQVEALTNLVAQSGAAGAPAGASSACVMNAHTMNVMQNTNIVNVNNVTIAPWGSPLQLTDADVEAALATVPGLAGTPALPEVVAALMELVKRAHMPPAARNIHLNPKRTDQALALTTGGWAAMPLEEATVALFDGASASMAAARAPSVRQTVRMSIPVQYRTERAASVALGLRPMGAHLLNVAPGGPGPLLIEAIAAAAGIVPAANMPPTAVTTTPRPGPRRRTTERGPSALQHTRRDRPHLAHRHHGGRRREHRRTRLGAAAGVGGRRPAPAVWPNGRRSCDFANERRMSTTIRMSEITIDLDNSANGAGPQTLRNQPAGEK